MLFIKQFGVVLVEWKIENGPWETVFFGRFKGYPVEVALNPEGIFLAAVFETKDGEKKGAMITVHKAFAADGHMEGFVETLERPCFGVVKNEVTKNLKLFFLSFRPIYADFGEKNWERSVDALVNKTYMETRTVVDLARALSLDLKELGTVSKMESEAILADPMILRSLVQAPVAAVKMEKVEVGPAKEPTKMFREAQLGLSKDKKIVSESIHLFERAVVFGGTKTERLSSLQVLAENFLLANKPVVFLDFENKFLSLKNANPSSKELREYLFPADILFRIILIFLIFSTVRGFLGTNTLALVVTGVLVYFLVVKWAYFTASAYVFLYVLLAFQVFSVVIWGIGMNLRR